MPDQKISRIREWVKTQVSPRRFKHIEGVARTAVKLARRYHLSPWKAETAAWLHDCAKEWTRARMRTQLRGSGFRLDPLEKRMPGLWHPHAGAAVALKKWGIRDPAILEAIRCHTLGKPGMKPLARLLFVADFIEPNRDFPGLRQARRAAGRGLEEGVLMKASITVALLFREGRTVHPRLLGTWNDFLKRRMNEGS